MQAIELAYSKFATAAAVKAAKGQRAGVLPYSAVEAQLAQSTPVRLASSFSGRSE